MNVKIRKGTSQDFPALLGLVLELADFEKSSGSVINSVEQMEMEKDSFEFLLAQNESEIIGMAVYFPAYSTWVGKSLYLDDLYVKKEYRGQKVGTKLLRGLFTIAQNENYNRLRWQVMDWNTGAKNFYEKIGAKMGDKWFNCDFDKAAILHFLKETGTDL